MMNVKVTGIHIDKCISVVHRVLFPTLCLFILRSSNAMQLALLCLRINGDALWHNDQNKCDKSSPTNDWHLLRIINTQCTARLVLVSLLCEAGYRITESAAWLDYYHTINYY
jgi:hypothetical protein